MTFGALWRRSVIAIWRIEVIVRAAPEEAAVSYNPLDMRRLTWLPVAPSTVPESRDLWRSLAAPCDCYVALFSEGEDEMRRCFLK